MYTARPLAVVKVVLLQLIDRANEWAKELQVAHRVFFEEANATVSLESMLSSYPGRLELATIQARQN